MKIADDKAVQYGKKMFWWGVVLILLLSLYQCGREFARKEAEAYRASHAPKGFIEGDLWINTGPSVVKPKIETKTTRKEMAGGRDVEITTNCREMNEYITTLSPGESVQVRHIDFGPALETRNRCSYSQNGASTPIFGNAREVTRPRFRHDLPFPDMPHGIVVFMIQDTSGKIVSHDYIKEAGGIIYFNNPLLEKAEVRLQYNFMQAFLTDPIMKEQIGWDGSTAKFHATRFSAGPSEVGSR